MKKLVVYICINSSIYLVNFNGFKKLVNFFSEKIRTFFKVSPEFASPEKFLRKKFDFLFEEDFEVTLKLLYHTVLRSYFKATSKLLQRNFEVSSKYCRSFVRTHC